MAENMQSGMTVKPFAKISEKSQGDKTPKTPPPPPKIHVLSSPGETGTIPLINSTHGGLKKPESPAVADLTTSAGKPAALEHHQPTKERLLEKRLQDKLGSLGPRHLARSTSSTTDPKHVTGAPGAGTTSAGQQPSRHAAGNNKEAAPSASSHTTTKCTGSSHETAASTTSTSPRPPGGGHQLTPEQLSDLREAFSLLDTDGSGSVDVHKLCRITLLLGLPTTEARVAEFMAAVDADGNGTIEFDEFCAAMRDKVDCPADEGDVVRAFKAFDRDRDGAVSLADFTFFNQMLGLDVPWVELEEMVRYTARDGVKVEYAEFRDVALAEPLSELELLD